MLIVLQASEALKHQTQPPMVVAVPQDPQFGAMYATMRHQPTPAGALRIAAQGELIPEFVPPPPPMFENGCGGPKPPGGQPGGVIKPPLPPGKPDKITVTVAKGKPLGAKGEKKRESTVWFFFFVYLPNFTFPPRHIQMIQ